MATIRSGTKSVLVVVDVQVGVMASCWEANRVVANVAQAVERARAGGVPVVWVQHESDELPRDSQSWQLVPELRPRSGEKRVYKRFPSSFEETNLESSLQEQGASHVVLAGAQTNWCIRATAYGALDRGYDLTLVKNAHTTESLDLGDGQAISASSMVTDLNVAMKWLRYPGRKNSTTTVEELSFPESSSSP